MSGLLTWIVGVPLLAGLFGVVDNPHQPSAPASPEVFESVEVGVAELSPGGEAGGYAVPASGSSYGCTLTLTPNPSNTGQNVTLTWSGGINPMTVTRGATNLNSRNSGWTDTGASSLAAGSYTYTVSGSVTTCTESDPKSGTCTHSNIDSYSCSAVLTVSAPRPDLTTSNVVLNSGTLVVNTPLTFRGTVQNSTAATGAGFNDQFSYRYGTSGAFTSFSTVAQAALTASGSAVNTSGNLTPNTAGTLQIQFCADSGSTITESNETNNCTIQSFTVTNPAAPTVSACTASPNPATTGQSVTWTATANGTAPLTYSWTGSDGLSGSYGVNTVSKSYNSSGVKNATVIVTDSYAQSSAPFNCTALTVNNPPTPTVDLTIREVGGGAWGGSVTVDAGDNVELQWSSSNADRCVGDSYFSTGGGQPTSGTQQTVSEPPSGARVYTVTCYDDDAGTQASDTVTVNVNAPSGNPNVTATPSRVQQGDQGSLDFDTGGHTNCVITGTNGDSFDLTTLYPGQQTGTITTGAINGETVYTMQCDLASDTTTVRIFPVFEEI